MLLFAFIWIMGGVTLVREAKEDRVIVCSYTFASSLEAGGIVLNFKELI